MEHIIQIANPRGTIFQSIIRNDEQCLELDASFTKVINHQKEHSELLIIDCNLILHVDSILCSFLIVVHTYSVTLLVEAVW